LFTLEQFSFTGQGPLLGSAKGQQEDEMTNWNFGH